MTVLRAQVVLPHDSGLSKDVITNTWHFNTYAGTAAANAQTVRTRLAAFYTGTPLAEGGPWTAFMGAHLGPGLITVKVYDLLDPEPRVPVHTGTFDITTEAGGSQLPAEVALCLSFQAQPASGVAQARRRGRVYLGPFDSTALAADGRPGTSVIARIRSAASVLLNANDANLRWAVYSKASEPDTGYDVHNGWVDNAWDTQRRRGLAPLTRVTFITAA